MTAYGIPHETLRDTFGLDRLRALDFSAEEEHEIAFNFWHLEICERIVESRIESAWHCIEAAALGEKVFLGPDRLCQGHLEGLPVGLVCSPAGILGLLQVLYHEMSKRGLFPKPLDPHMAPASWEFDCDDGTSVELLSHGHRIAQIMYRQHNVHACIAALQAYAIADWANNHRRYALTS